MNEEDIYDILASTVYDLVVPDKGILAADESLSTIAKRFADIAVENTRENRTIYRNLLCETKGLSDYISGVILFPETLQQKSNSGETIADVLTHAGIVPGVKVDQGLSTLTALTQEKITQGLDGLLERLTLYKQQGARFAKWRCVYNITDEFPSKIGIKSNAEVLARYAAMCQSVGIVPIVEPELLMTGNHDLQAAAVVSENILNAVFAALRKHGVALELMLLKPHMILAGEDNPTQATPDEVADATLAVFLRCVPAAVPGIVFLSGGQTPEQATTNLQAIVERVDYAPWNLSFSFGRALQQPVLECWRGKEENIPAAQKALLRQAKQNCMALA